MDPRLIASIAERLSSRRQWLATAESCTGGLIAKHLTDLAGSSQWFERGVVTYSNRAKTELLGVPQALIDAEGAVSEACAIAMAEGLLQRASVQWTISVTGIAGPAGGSAQKPVGTVWIGTCGEDGASARHYLFEGDRESIRLQAATAAVKQLHARL